MGLFFFHTSPRGSDNLIDDFVVVLSTSGKRLDSASSHAIVTAFHILSNSLFTNHFTISRFVFWTTDVVVVAYQE